MGNPHDKTRGTALILYDIIWNVAFLILYIITRLPGNPVTGKGGDVDVIDMVCELTQIAYVATTIIILAKLHSIKYIPYEQTK